MGQKNLLKNENAIIPQSMHMLALMPAESVFLIEMCRCPVKSVLHLPRRFCFCVCVCVGVGSITKLADLLAHFVERLLVGQ